jgi:hypothetical protein
MSKYWQINNTTMQKSYTKKAEWKKKGLFNAPLQHLNRKARRKGTKNYNA